MFNVWSSKNSNSIGNHALMFCLKFPTYPSIIFI